MTLTEFLLIYLSVIATLLFFVMIAILTAIRFAISHAIPLIPKIHKLIEKFGGGGNGKEGGGIDIGSLVTSLFGGVFK